MNGTKKLFVTMILLLFAFNALATPFMLFKIQQEQNSRCDQVNNMANAIVAIVAYVNAPNPNRPPRSVQQQQQVDAFVKASNDLLDDARPC